MMGRILSQIAGKMPTVLRRSLLGTPDQPTALATAVHRILNVLPVERFPVLSCQGPLDGYRMRVDWKTQRSFAYGTWEPAVVEAIQAQVEPGMTALDIGAHVGFYTLLLARLVGAAGRVFSFEPIPGNYRRLEENIQLNRLQQVTPVNHAVLARSCEIEANVPGDEPCSGSISLYQDYGTPRVRVTAVSLDEYFGDAMGRVDFIKMDVEGAEGEVLQGGTETIRKFRPRLLVELHHFDGDVSANPVPSMLERMEYQIRWLERWELTSHILAVPAAGRMAVR